MLEYRKRRLTTPKPLISSRRPFPNTFSGSDLILVTKDSDFYEGAFSEIKVVWIRRGNCSTADIEAILRRYHPEIASLAEIANLDMLMLY